VLKEQAQLTLLDADETLPRFMLEGMPDGDVFKEIAAGVIERARAGGRYPKVRWWGEMVNVLWEQGNTPAATKCLTALKVEEVVSTQKARPYTVESVRVTGTEVEFRLYPFSQ
jgi:hypothetical protein